MASIINGALEPEYTGYRLESVDDTTPYEEWVKASRRNRGLGKGVRIPEEDFPRTARFVRGAKAFDYNVYGGFAPIISDRLKVAMEDIEPNIHQFSPVKITQANGRLYPEAFWYFVVCTKIDAITDELGGVYKGKWGSQPDEFHWVIKPGGFDRLAVRKSAIAGRAMWLDMRYPVGIFFSEALLEAMRADQMTGWSTIDNWSEI